MTKYVFDASALIALAHEEPGGMLVEKLLAGPHNRCFAHAANLCEAYYDAFRRGKGDLANSVISDFARAGLEFRPDMDTAFWQRAGLLKARVKRISLADCFGLTLANRLNAEFVSADHHELERITGEFRIRFIR